LLLDVPVFTLERWPRDCPSNGRLTDRIYRQVMGQDRRQNNVRVRFSLPVSAWMMGIDGTWRRACFIEDVSDTGAKLTVESALEGLYLKEFFLLLSSTGLAYRRCELVWVHGEQIGVSFLKTGKPRRAA
jgi:hypothetical protein